MKHQPAQKKTTHQRRIERATAVRTEHDPLLERELQLDHEAFAREFAAFLTGDEQLPRQRHLCPWYRRHGVEERDR